MHVSLEHPASGEKQDLPESVLVQNSGHVDDDIHNLALDVFHEIDERKSLNIKEVLEWYGEKDAGDLRRSEVNEFGENMFCLSAFEGNFGNVRKSCESEKSNQNIVMTEKL